VGVGVARQYRIMIPDRDVVGRRLLSHATLKTREFSSINTPLLVRRRPLRP